MVIVIVMMMLAGRVAALGSLLGSGHGHVRPATADRHRPEHRSNSSSKPPRRAANFERDQYSPAKRSERTFLCREL